MNRSYRILSSLLLLLPLLAQADPFPPSWDSGTGAAIHYSPAPWPSEPANAADCGDSCGQWKPYTRFQNSVNDPRSQDSSNGGTAPQNYVNIASSCVDTGEPSIYYYLHQGATEADDVIMFRWRVEQIANNYATGPNAGSYSSSSPWSSALWTVLFDIDGSGYRSLAAHLNGSSGNPSAAVDMLAGIWSQSPTQSIDYINDPSVHLLGHNPTAFVDQASGKILNFQNSLTPVASWPNGSAETTWDYGTTRSRLVTTRSCNEYFVDYQIPVAMLDASALGGPKISRSTPISMMFCTANSLNNPFQKDCAINKTWTADSNKPAPFGDYISFDKNQPYSQPIIADVKAIAPASCGQDYRLTARIQDALALVNGAVTPSVKAVAFYYWYDANGSGDADEVGGVWIHAADATRAPDSLNTWNANWNASSLPKGRYLIGVQAVDDNTLVDDGMLPSGIDNRTFSYIAGDAQSQIYIDGAWISGQQALFPEHSPIQTPAAGENWYGNPDVTGIQTAKVGVALNTCGVAPTLAVAADASEVAAGATLTLTLTLSNAGNSQAITVSNLSNLLPDGFSYQDGTTTGDFGTANPNISAQSLSWDFASPVTIPANGSATLSFIASASSNAGNYNDSATATTSFADLAADPIAIAVGTAQLALSITPDSYSTSPGGQVTYTLNYSNPSSVAVTASNLGISLPANTSFQSCSDSCNSGSGSVAWSLATLSPGAGGSVTLVLDIDAGYALSALTLSASLSGTDANANPVAIAAQSTLYVNVPAPASAAFTLDGSADAVQIAPGGSVTYSFSYHNFGAGSASNAVITSPLPAGMNYVSSTAGGVESSGTVSWNLGTIASDASGTVTLTVSADNPFVTANPANSSAEISWDGGTPVNAAVSVGVSGLACNAYYFRDSTISINTGSERIANTDVPTAVTAASISFPVTTTPAEAVRFYQDPPNTSAITFAGDLTTYFYITKPSGPQLDMDVYVYDFDPATPASDGILLGSGSFTQTGSGTNQLFSFVTTLSGTLAKNHRLLWIFDAYSNNTSTFVLNFDGASSQSRAEYCVNAPASLSIAKTVDLATVPENTTSNVVYTIQYANTGSSTANNVVIVDTLPAAVSFTSATLNATPISPTGSNPYSFAIGTLAANSSGTLIINASVSNAATGTLINNATISSDETSALADTASIVVGTPGGATAPELYIDKVASTGLVLAGESVSYTLSVVNTGNGAASNVVVSDDFPEQSYFSYVDCSTATGSCSESPAGSLSWNIGTLAAGASATLSYSMLTASTGIPAGLTQLNNSAQVSDDNYCTGTPPAGCSSDTLTVTVSGNPQLAIGVSADKAAAVPGDVIVYTLLVNNNGSSTANEVSVINPIPDYTGFVAITSGSGSFDTLNNRVIFSNAALAAGSSDSFSFSVQVLNPLASGDSIISDTASASAANAAAVSDSVTTTASAAPQISLGILGTDNIPLPATTLVADASNSNTLSVASAALLHIGDTLYINATTTTIAAITGNQLSVDTAVTASSNEAVMLAATYSITYQNTGNADASNVQVSEPLPAGWLYLGASPAASSAPAIGSNGSVSWSLATIAAGASGTLQVVAVPTLSGSISHTATLTGDGSINEVATVDTAVGGLTIEKTASSNNATPGGSVSYTISVSNSLSSAVNGVAIKDILPAGFSYAASLTAPDSFENGDLGRPVWLVDVAANSSLVIEFSADISADIGAATYQNEVEVIAPAGVGVASFDALATTSEDVTLLSGSGLFSGQVSFGNAPLSGVWLDFYENNVLAYKVYSDSNGYFQSVLEAGNNWRVEISSDSDNIALLSGLSLTTGTDPENFSVATGESLTRNYVYSLTAPSVNTLTTSDRTPTITGTWPSVVSAGMFTVTVNGISYSPGSDLVLNGDNWTLTIPLSDQLGDGSYDVIATITAGANSSSDTTSNELVIASIDSDGDGVGDIIDLDDDNDGIPDSLEGDGAVDSDGDGVPDSLDLDSDNDGLFDLVESGASNVSTLDSNKDGHIDSGFNFGSNGLADDVETTIDSGTVNYNSGSPLDSDGDGVEDFRDLDSDNDGIPDVTESGGSDPDGDGVIGSGTPAVDANGLAGGAGLTPQDSDGDGIGDQLEIDADNDGIYDLVEAGGVDSDNDGRVDGFSDTNGDGFDDGIATTPLPLTDSDGDGIPDYQDNDDNDNDGLPDSVDLDDDNDGIPDSLEGDGAIDTDADGIADSLDLDSDNDGIYDLVESGAANTGTLDSDNDGRIDSSFSIGNNGLADVIETYVDRATINYNAGTPVDSDGDGVADFRDLDSDNDGIADVTEAGGSDPDRDGIIGSGTPVVNNSGLAKDAGTVPRDSDGDGIEDYLDLDSDNDGVFDLVEAGGSDNNNNGQVDNFSDADNNGLDDTIAASPLPLTDSDGDNIPDYLDTVENRNNVIRTGVKGVGALDIWIYLLLVPVLLLARKGRCSRVILVLVMLPLSFFAKADQAVEDNPVFTRSVYLGAGFGRSLMAPLTDGTIYSIDQDTDSGKKIYIGFDYSEYLSAEFSYSDLGTTVLKPVASIDYSVIAFNAVYYFYDQAENDHLGWAGYLKAGLGSISNSASVPYQQNNSADVSIGAGIEYGWSNGIAARLDIESFDVDASLITLGVLYRFGKNSQKAPTRLDMDGDRVYDDIDQCPHTAPGKMVDATGCELDSDKDGVSDGNDQCPQTPAGVKVDARGCGNDSDGDGVLNDIDKCPTTVKGASVNSVGCAIFETKLDGVNFESASADLTDGAKEVLNRAAVALAQFPTMRIEIQAHTDSIGDSHVNQALSEARAKSVARYLESKGISRERMEPRGYGESRPLLSNLTAAGRAQNRRVEFRVIQSDMISEPR